MRTAYRVLAFAIAAMVAIQAGAIGYAVFAQFNWIEEGGTFDKAAFDTGAPGTGAFMFHALFAGAVLLTSLAMLIISFFAKIPQGVRWAVIVSANDGGATGSRPPSNSSTGTSLVAATSGPPGTGGTAQTSHTG